MIVLRPEFCLVCSPVQDRDTPLFQGQRESQVCLYVLFAKELGQDDGVFSSFFGRLQCLRVLISIRATAGSPQGARCAGSSMRAGLAVGASRARSCARPGVSPRAAPVRPGI